MKKELIDKEEELICEEIRIEQEITKNSILDRLSMAEHLFNTKLPEVFNIGVETAESLSKDFKLPLKVKGVFLTEGRPQRKWYTAEELENSVKNQVNQKFPIMQDHREGETSVIIGVVERLKFDPNIQTVEGVKPGIRWWGHINDETSARNIFDDVITKVSVTVYSEEFLDEKYGISGRGLTFSELSTVRSGASLGNSIGVDK